MAMPESLTAELEALEISHRFVKEPDRWYGAVIDVTATLPSGDSVTFNVSGPHLAYDDLQPATVNWSAIGSVPAEDAAAFAAALAYCSVLAPTLNGPVAA